MSHTRRNSRLEHGLSTSWLGLLLLFAAGPTPAAGLPTPVKLCYSNQGDYPWTMPDRPGLNTLLIQHAANKTHIPLEMQGMPWGHCLLKVAEGKFDGAFNSSLIPERTRFARYPMKNGQIDASRRLMRANYDLLRVKRDKAVQWDGQHLTAPGKVGVVTSYYSITARLKSFGVTEIDQQQSTSAKVLDSLLEGHISAAALKSGEAQRLMQDPKYNSRLELLTPPLQEKDFFLIFSIAYARSHPQITEQLWDAIGQERDTAHWKKIEQNFK